MGDGRRNEDWAEQRERAVQAHAAALQARRTAEARQARELIAAFVREAVARGLPDTALTARAYNGRGTYRTGLRGWYLTPDRSIGVDRAGEFYVLSVAPSLRARVTGAVVEPQEPKLIIGEGARDGESMPLDTLLRRRLDDGGTAP